LNNYQNQLLNNFSSIEDKNLDWVRKYIVIIFILLLVFITLKISNAYFPIYTLSIIYLYLLLISAFICLIAFRFITSQNFYLAPNFQEKLYQDAELNMDTLSAKVQLSKSYVSKIINQKEGKNFYEFVNSYRVEEVKNNLNNLEYAHYSILGIGLAAGFKSKSTFNAIFKKMTGMTPSVYKKTFK